MSRVWRNAPRPPRLAFRSSDSSACTGPERARGTRRVDARRLRHRREGVLSQRSPRASGPRCRRARRLGHLDLGKSRIVCAAALFADATREAGQHFLGWVCSEVPGYASTHGLKAKLHVREYPMRPWVELEPTSHPLALDQRQGLAPDRAIAIAQGLLHPPVR